MILRKINFIFIASIFFILININLAQAFTGDLNNDCKVNIFDVVIASNAYSSSCNNQTCSSDNSCWGNYSSCSSRGKWNPKADLDKNGVVNIFDIVMISGSYGKNVPLSTACEADGQFCTLDHCDGLGNCIYWKPYDCSDNLYCTVNERCDETQDKCVYNNRDCSANNLQGIATCDNIPDNWHFTWDYRQAFTSLCNEVSDICTTGDSTITHTCSKSQCSAECDATNPCAPTDCDTLDGCYNGKYRNYNDVENTCQTDCTCTDNSCSSYTLTGTDADNDGWDVQCNDCNDADDEMFPGNVEVCDGKDNDCDGLTDEDVLLTFYRDFDSDTYGNVSVSTQDCSAPSGYVSDNTDCNDNNANINPGATEVCDGIDNDCDGQVDEGVSVIIQVVDSGGQGLPDYEVDLDCVYKGITNNEGILQICGVAEGDYTVTAFSISNCHGEAGLLVDSYGQGSATVWPDSDTICYWYYHNCV